MLGRLTRTVVDFLLQAHQLQAEKRHLLFIHVLAVGHGQNFGIRQFFGRLGFPVVRQLGVFFGSREGGVHLRGRGHCV
ncbi:hypothetical protein D3C71_2056130 [compost metagenome]